LLLLAFAGLLSNAQSPPETAAQRTPVMEQGRAPEEVVAEGKVIGRRVPTVKGEICAQCLQPLGENDAAYQVQGQRIALHHHEVESDLGAQLQRLVAAIQPRGAFLGAGAEGAGISQFWFFAGLYVLAGLVFGALAAHRALNSGYGAVRWFFVGFLLTLPGYLYLLTRPKREVAAPAGVPPGLKKIAATYSPVACVACGTENHPSAAECSGCKKKLEPRIASEVARAGVR
jgi:hypothetical protein